MSLPAEPPARQRRKEARPQELLDAALELFVEKGFAATKIDDVARRAGVSKGTLYLYYTSKEELLKAVIHHYLGQEIASGAAEVDAHTGTAADLLTVVLTRWWQRIFTSPASGVFKIALTEMRNFPDIAAFYMSEVIQPGEEVIGRIVQRGISRREFRRVDVPNAVHSLLLPMVMLCLHKHSVAACLPPAPAFDPEAFIGQHMQLVLDGLARRPTT